MNTPGPFITSASDRYRGFFRVAFFPIAAAAATTTTTAIAHLSVAGYVAGDHPTLQPALISIVSRASRAEERRFLSSSAAASTTIIIECCDEKA
uniref:Uncharacterized protein n=1 Tax=Oryza nivara TaxID=4536 RepID=A0A0E0FG17_ORYNI